MARKRIKIPIRLKVTRKVTLTGSLRCPFCGYPVRRSLNRTGQTIKCPRCQNNVVI